VLLTLKEKNMSADGKEFDVIVWGATGFTGRLVAENLLARYGAGGDLKWAMAGRSEDKLKRVREAFGDGSERIPLVVADSHDPASLEAMVGRTAVVCSTVGPFAKHGSGLVAACAGAGTDYCDITGEVQWVRRMIDAHAEEAAASGARIVHCCGFDSIPSDLGVLYTHRRMEQLHGGTCERIGLRVKRMKGAFSGGTVASLLNALDEARVDKSARRTMGNPYGLNPEGETRGPDGPDQRSVRWDADVNSWTAPFVMAAINTRVVRRSNAIMGYPYGKGFRYDEAVMTGSGPAGWSRAAAMTGSLVAFVTAASVGPARALLNRLFLPQPGEGPDAEAREKGYFDIVLVGKRGGATVRTRVRGDRDPGYGATSRMLGESAVCLARDDLPTTGGSWTPASCMGEALIRRLEDSAGMSFSLVED
jgi:short subunit dehydrogenase-like uncharacterized protein